MKTNIIKGLIATLLLLICLLSPASAASYDDVPWKFAGWSTATTTYKNRIIDNYEVLVRLDNIEGNMPKEWEKTITRERRTDWYGTVGNEISSDITLKAGVPGLGTIEGGLASKIETSVGYNYANTVRETVRLLVQCAPGFRIEERRYVYGDRINVYAKYFIGGIRTKKVHGDIYMPRFFEYKSVEY